VSRQSKEHFSGLKHSGWAMEARFRDCQDTLTLLEVLRGIWAQRPQGADFQKPFFVGLTLRNLIPESEYQAELFADEGNRAGLSATMDKLNLKYGHITLHFSGMLPARESAPTASPSRRFPSSTGLTTCSRYAARSSTTIVSAIRSCTHCRFRLMKNCRKPKPASSANAPYPGDRSITCQTRHKQTRRGAAPLHYAQHVAPGEGNSGQPVILVERPKQRRSILIDSRGFQVSAQVLLRFVMQPDELFLVSLLQKPQPPSFTLQAVITAFEFQHCAYQPVYMWRRKPTGSSHQLRESKDQYFLASGVSLRGLICSAASPQPIQEVQVNGKVRGFDHAYARPLTASIPEGLRDCDSQS
jgi:hypothetical protein